MNTSAVARRMKKNRSFKKRVEWYLLGQRRCHCCGVQFNWATGHKNSASVEHMIPVCKGGTFHMQNILLTCSSCNSNRGNMDWIKFIEKNNFPKKEWLIQKYIKAVEHNRTLKTETHITIFKNMKTYLENQKKAA